MDKREAEKILELEGRYSATDLRKAYLNALKLYHPDKYSKESQEYADATRLTAEVNVAKDLLQEYFDEGEDTLVSEPIVQEDPTPSASNAGASWIDRNPSTYNFVQSLESVLSRRNY